MAGIYQNDRFSIMATAPNASVGPVHKRMPAAPSEHEVPLWFSPDFQVLFDRTGIELTAAPLGADATNLPAASAKPDAAPVPSQQTLW